MFWIGTYSTTEKLRLLSNYQDSDYSLGVYADYHQVRTSSLNRWIKQFLTAGLAGLIRPEHNHRYTLQTKRSAVKAYLSGTLSGQAILNRYQIRSLSQLHQWIVRYNSGQLSVAYATRKRARKVGRLLRRNGKLLNGQLITSITIKPRQKNLMSAINGSIHGYESTKELTIGNPFRITGIAIKAKHQPMKWKDYDKK